MTDIEFSTESKEQIEEYINRLMHVVFNVFLIESKVHPEFYETDMYVPSGKRVAIVYPGGRTELGCAYEGKRPK